MDAKFILIDIPTGITDGKLTASINDEFSEMILGSYDRIIRSTILEKYAGSARIHLEHGHHHISEFTHTVFGVNAGEIINEYLVVPDTSR